MPLRTSTRLERLLRRDDVASHACEPGNEYWYRPGQLLVHRQDLHDRERFPTLERDLRHWGARPLEGWPEDLALLGEYDIGVVRFALPVEVDVPTVVRRLREVVAGPVPRVAANHVFGAAPRSGFGPGDNPVPADQALPELFQNGDRDARYVVGVLDTGIVLDRGHNPHLAAQHDLVLDPGVDDDVLDTEPADGMLDDADVHGGFIAGIVAQHAPDATVRVAKVLLGGLTDDVHIANGILRLAGAQVLNLSLGGYTDQNLEPLTIVEALARLRSGPVVVAAAGNDAQRRPFWPAAMKGVIGVGAVEAPDDRLAADPAFVPPAAWFTNRGGWVDACAHGVKVLSTFAAFAEQTAAATETAHDFKGWAYWSGTSFAAPRVAACIIRKAMALGGDPTEAAHRAAWEILHTPSPRRVPDLGVFVP